MADKRSCREYCRFSQYCHREGELGLDPEDCPAAWRIEDLMENKPEEAEEQKNEL
jgi:hypothetical protein